MKEFPKQLRIAAVVVAGGLVAVLGAAGYRHASHENSAVPYIKQAIPAITKWNAELTRSYMAPQALMNISDESFSRIVAWESQLGQLREMREPHFQNFLAGTDPTLGNYRIAIYTVPARFDAGDANITIGLLDQDGKFSVFLFHIGSAALTGSRAAVSSPTGLAPYHAPGS